MMDKLNCIMVIDDDEPTNFISTMIIDEADCSHHLEVMESGSKALQYLHNAMDSHNPGTSRMPDIIFLDINMPRMNGWEFLEEYLKLPASQRPQPVIVMLTTSQNPDDKLKASGIPEVSEFFIKPLTVEMIEQVITTHFGAIHCPVAPHIEIFPGRKPQKQHQPNLK